MGNSSAQRDAMAAAAAAASAVAAASNGAVLQTADYSRGYSTMASVGHGQMLPPPTQIHSQQPQQSHQHQQQQHSQYSSHQAHHHSLPSIDMNSHPAASMAVAGYQSSYGLADGTSATNGMVSLMSSPTAASWGAAGAGASSLSSPSSAVAQAAALAANHQQQQHHHHQQAGSWYGSMYQQHQYSPSSHGMVMYHDGYATSPTAAAAAAAYYPPARARLTTTLWEDEQTLVYQVDCRGICVARRHDDNMINGTKLLNVVGMSRGKRDGILKNEKGRRVVKVGPMHLKGVWIPFDRARFLAEQFKVLDVLFPIFQPDPNSYLYGTIPINSPTSAAGLPTSSDPYSAAAASGYSQLAATRAQDAYDPTSTVAAAAAAAAANTPATTAGTTPAGSSTASHSHSASLSQTMVSPGMLHQSHHHHSMSQSNLQQAANQQQQQQQQQGLGITYIGSPPRLAGIPSSPPMSGMSAGPVSPSVSYVDKNARYTPYGSSGFQTASSKSGPGSKRGSIDHHYHTSIHTPLLQQQHNGYSAAQTTGGAVAAVHHSQQQDGVSADQDATGTGVSAAQQQQQPAMTSSYFDGLLAKSEQ
ncbi:hypothetical protein EV177_008488 [Coemansia sp. RSA 1804]|nr:hypothetical protein EV177_008488 [Coemansia sp. RSA 1804]